MQRLPSASTARKCSKYNHLDSVRTNGALVKRQSFPKSFSPNVCSFHHLSPQNAPPLGDSILSAPRSSCRSPHSGLTFLGKSSSVWSSIYFPKDIISDEAEFGNIATCPGMAHVISYSLSLFICQVGLITLTPQGCFKSKEENAQGSASSFIKHCKNNNNHISS